MTYASQKIFLLTAQWKDNQEYPLEYYASSEQGPVLLRFKSERFTLFVDHDANISSFGQTIDQKQINLTSFEGRQVKAIYCYSQNDFFNFKNYCQQNGIRTYENDIWPTQRFLMERFIFGQVEVSGETQNKDGLIIYEQPHIKATSYQPNLQILSFDIETGVDGSVYSIGVDYGPLNKLQHVYMRSDEDKKIDQKLTYYRNEKSMILAFIEDLQKYDPDIIIGWHVIGFDLQFLSNRCFKLGIPFNIGRQNKEIKIEEKKGIGFFAHIEGRVVLDGPPTLRNAFYKFKNFKLETVASEVLGIGKDIASDGGKVEEIERRFKEDKIALAKYNLLDCTLVSDIFNKLKLVELAIERVKISGLLFDKQGISTASFDHYLLPLFHRKGIVAPNSSDMQREELSTGGMVIEPKTGHHKNVAVFDFKSLYPSLIRTFHIDPYSRLKAKNDTISLPNGIKFSKQEHFLPQIIHGLMDKREKAKQTHNKALNMAIKILMNSFYGVMGSLRCRFYHSDLPKAITQTGHWILNQAIDFFKNRDYQVLYGDTDSLFIQMNIEDNKEQAQALAKELNEYLTLIINDEFKIESFLELEFEKLYSDIFFSTMRESTSGAKKRYAGLINGELDFVGMEYVRSDWTQLAKNFQFQLYEHYFMDRPIESFIKDFVHKLKNGQFDQSLVYTKKLSKDPKEYTKNIPQHVKAALLVNHTGPYRLKEVSYIMTQHGPIPVQNEIKNIDYAHYIDKQIRPIADQILKSQGKDFESLEVGDQLSLI